MRPHIRVLYQQSADLLGTGADSLFLVLRDTRGGFPPIRSDELGIWDNKKGRLKRTFLFRPQGKGTLALRYEPIAARDIDENNTADLVGSFVYRVPDSESLLYHPVTISGSSGKYLLSTVLSTEPLERLRAHREKLPKELYERYSTPLNLGGEDWSGGPLQSYPTQFAGLKKVQVSSGGPQGTRLAVFVGYATEEQDEGGSPPRLHTEAWVGYTEGGVLYVKCRDVVESEANTAEPLVSQAVSAWGNEGKAC